MSTLPGGHASQLVLPVPALAEPMGQIVQLNCPVWLLYWPVAHSLQLDWSSWFWYWPSIQVKQALLSELIYDPALQSSLQLD